MSDSPPPDYVSTNVRLPVGLHRALKHRAVMEGRSLGQIVRESVENYLTARPAQLADLPDWSSDPLARVLEGLGPATVDDAAENHDKYLYGELASDQKPT